MRLLPLTMPLMISVLLLSGLNACMTTSSRQGEQAVHWQKSGMTEDRRRADFNACRRHAYNLARRDSEPLGGLGHRDDNQQQQMMARYDSKQSYTKTLTRCMHSLGYYLAGNRPAAPAKKEDRQ